MDWAKVKNILIIALILTNLIIAFFIYDNKRSHQVLDESEQLARLEQILSERNITNDVQIDDENLTIPAFALSYEDYDPAKVLGGNFQLENGRYFNGVYFLDIRANTFVISLPENRFASSINAYPTLDRAKARTRELVEDQLFFPSDYRFESVSEIENGIELIYHQYYRDYYIVDSYMKVWVNNDGVIRLERKWMEVTEKEGEFLNLITYPNALFLALDQFVSTDGEQKTKIVDLKMGLKLEQTVFNSNIKSGDAMPYYQLILSPKKTILVPALNNE